MLYRRGIGGPFGRVSLEDERYVHSCFFQDSSVDLRFPMKQSDPLRVDLLYGSCFHWLSG